MVRERTDAADKGDLPDLCSAKAVLAVVLIAELIAIVLTLADHGPRDGFLLALSTTSLYILWLALTCAAALCLARPRLAGMSRLRALSISFVLLQLVSLLISEAGWLLNSRLANGQLSDLPHDEFLLRNSAVFAIVSAMALRYLFVAGEWRRNVALEAQARIRALQARIRPHFLFNSMNTIAALTRSDPVRAEQAIEDLADLFRATLGESEHRIALKEELEVARIYQRMEQLRLGDRLQVEWRVTELPMRALIPGLTVQPLLENAIYHGIEPLPDGGVVVVDGGCDNGTISLTITNPVASDPPQTSARRGNRMALDNIRRRFALGFDGAATVEIDAGEREYQVRLRFPESYA
ncbi:MAG: histidine kinase [Pseudomonadota bacterium]